MEQGTQFSIVLRRHGKGESQEDEERVVDLSSQVHLLHCSIKFNGPSNVSQYFKPKPTGIESEGLRTQEACFRGRKLQGASISVPDGYSGFVLGKKRLGKRNRSDNSDGSSNCWEMNAKYKSITYWNHGSLPSQDDAALNTHFGLRKSLECEVKKVHNLAILVGKNSKSRSKNEHTDTPFFSLPHRLCFYQ